MSLGENESKTCYIVVVQRCISFSSCRSFRRQLQTGNACYNHVGQHIYSSRRLQPILTEVDASQYQAQNSYARVESDDYVDDIDSRRRRLCNIFLVELLSSWVSEREHCTACAVTAWVRPCDSWLEPPESYHRIRMRTLNEGRVNKNGSCF